MDPRSDWLQQGFRVLPEWILYWFDTVWFDDEGEGVFLHQQT